jgi:peptidase A4-like protein
MKSVVLRVGCLIMLIAASSPATAASGSLVHRPRIPVEAPTGAGWASSNWSGYATTGTGLNAATGSWVVQAVSPSRGASYSSQWVGIDGFNNNDLIQTGTESDYYSGRAHYDAWWEILPAAETVIPSITVRPGDVMSASVKQVSGTSWSISITDRTTGQTFSTTQTYTGPRTSAEWVEEAPTVGGRVATLAHYGLTTFDPGTLNGKNPGLTSADSGVMIQKNRQVSTPSTPDRDTDGFNMQYGSTAPAPPPS